MIRTLFVIGVFVVFAASCDSSSQCSTAGDCFAGEICIDKQCVVDDGQTTDVGNNPTDMSGNNPTDMSGVDIAEDVDIDTDVPDVTSDSEPDLPPLLACQVDPLTSSCTDDMWEVNNTWIQGKKLSTQSRPGCMIRNTFVGMDYTIEPIICARDPADWFYIEFDPCEENDIRITWTLTPSYECSAELFGLDSLSYSCGTEATCTQTDSQSTAVIDIPATGLRQFQVSYVEVKGMEGVQMPYSLRVQVESL